jgi:hypothetical protein
MEEDKIKGDVFLVGEGSYSDPLLPSPSLGNRTPRINLVKVDVGPQG